MKIFRIIPPSVIELLFALIMAGCTIYYYVQEDAVLANVFAANAIGWFVMYRVTAFQNSIYKRLSATFAAIDENFEKLYNSRPSKKELQRVLDKIHTSIGEISDEMDELQKERT